MTQVAKEVVLFLSTEGSALLTVQPRFGRTRCWSSREDGLPGSRPGPRSNARWPLAVAWGGDIMERRNSWRSSAIRASAHACEWTVHRRARPGIRGIMRPSSCSF